MELRANPNRIEVTQEEQSLVLAVLENYEILVNSQAEQITLGEPFTQEEAAVLDLQKMLRKIIQQVLGFDYALLGTNLTVIDKFLEILSLYKVRDPSVDLKITSVTEDAKKIRTQFESMLITQWDRANNRAG